MLKVNGVEITPDRTLSAIVAELTPGTRIPIELLRQGRPQTLTAVVAKRPNPQEMAKNFGAPPAPTNPFAAPEKQGEGLAGDALGLQILGMTPALAERLRVPGDTKGVVVASVDSASDAANRGLQQADIVVGVNFTAIGGVAQFEAAIKAAKTAGRPSITLEVLRPGQPGTVFIALRLR